MLSSSQKKGWMHLECSRTKPASWPLNRGPKWKWSSFSYQENCRWRRRAFNHKAPWAVKRTEIADSLLASCESFSDQFAWCRDHSERTPQVRAPQLSRADAYRVHRNTVAAIRQRDPGGWGDTMVSNIVFRWSTACEHQSNGQYQYCFHLCSPLILPASFTIRQSKTSYGFQNNVDSKHAQEAARIYSNSSAIPRNL